MKMTTKMIMLQNIEKMVMEQQRVDENDSYIRQDNEGSEVSGKTI